MPVISIPVFMGLNQYNDKYIVQNDYFSLQNKISKATHQKCNVQFSDMTRQYGSFTFHGIVQFHVNQMYIRLH